MGDKHVSKSLIAAAATALIVIIAVTPVLSSRASAVLLTVKVFNRASCSLRQCPERGAMLTTVHVGSEHTSFEAKACGPFDSHPCVGPTKEYILQPGQSFGVVGEFFGCAPECSFKPEVLHIFIAPPVPPDVNGTCRDITVHGNGSCSGNIGKSPVNIEINYHWEHT
jgi:hypothetical protein